VSTTLRKGWLGLLRMAGKKRFVARSGLGHRFVGFPGDTFAENPFYNLGAYRPELELCASWLRLEPDPVVFDVGANVGFWSTQLSQMLGDKSLMVHAFEPVPQTFCRLVESVRLLELRDRISPFCVAIGNRTKVVHVSVNPRNSGLAQVSGGTLNKRAGDRLESAFALSMDDVVDALGVSPTLVKIDVEGSEVDVLQGARRLLSRPDLPALLFEFNPITLAETQTSTLAFDELLASYSFFYVDDFEGQRWPLFTPIEHLSELGWVCNVFALPNTNSNRDRFDLAAASALSRLRK
jgi:FkbM family methyltransferase